MHENLQKSQDVFLGKMNRICNKSGLNSVMVQLYAILYLSNKPLSLDDMVEQLKISKGSVSINIRALENYGAVRRVWMKGSRRDYYEAEVDIAKVVMDRIRSMIGDRLTEAEEMLNSTYAMLSSVEASDKNDEEAIRLFRQRLEGVKDLCDKARAIFDLFNSSILKNIMEIGHKENGKKELVSIT